MSQKKLRSLLRIPKFPAWAILWDTSSEAALDSEKQKENFKATQKTSKRPRKIEEEEVAHEEIKPEEIKPKMAIYTDEELAELAKEEEYEDYDYDDSDEDIDYDEFDEYYDDDNN